MIRLKVVLKDFSDSLPSAKPIYAIESEEPVSLSAANIIRHRVR